MSIYYHEEAGSHVHEEQKFKYETVVGPVIVGEFSTKDKEVFRAVGQYQGRGKRELHVNNE